MSTGLLESLVLIDLTIDLNENDRAQFEAFKLTLELLLKTPSGKEPDFSLLLSNLSAINYLIIQLPAGEPSTTPEKILQEALNKASTIMPKSDSKTDIDRCNEARQAFVKANLFLNLKHNNTCNREAFTNLGNSALVSAYPAIALEGLKEINIDLFNDNEKALFARRLIAAHTKVTLNHLAGLPPQKTSILSSIFSSKDTHQRTITCLTKFLEDLRAIDSISEIKKLIVSLPDIEHVAKLKVIFSSELINPKLMPALSTAAPRI